MKQTCLLMVLVLLGGAILGVVAIVFAVNRAFTSFEVHRDSMGIRHDLVVSEEKLRFSPGYDAIIWCRFKVVAKSINDVFDPARVDATQFSDKNFQFRVAEITNDWWDADRQTLTGGEVEIGGDFMRVGFVDNGDGTLTVYIYWFEV